MNFRCTREPLLAALQTAAVVVPTRSTRPVLTNVKLEVDGSTAVLSATDLEIGIRTEIEGVETTAAGSVLLPSARLMAIVRESPPGTTFERLSPMETQQLSRLLEVSFVYRQKIQSNSHQ